MRISKHQKAVMMAVNYGSMTEGAIFGFTQFERLHVTLRSLVGRKLMKERLEDFGRGKEGVYSLTPSGLKIAKGRGWI